MSKYRSEEWLYKKYHEERMTMGEMATETGVAKSTIHKWMKKHGIERRCIGEYHTADRPYTDSEWLQRKYHDENLSTYEIAKICDCDSSVIWRCLERYGIETRTISESRTEYTIDSEWLRIKYVKEKLTAYEIADLIGCSSRVIYHRLEKYNIPTRENAGEYHPFWKGGVTPLKGKIRDSPKYCEWRLNVFTRDGFTCQWCEQATRDIQADHIIPLSYLMENYQIKTLKEAKACAALWELENGRTLCYECHKATPTYGNSGRYSNIELKKLDKMAMLKRKGERNE